MELIGRSGELEALSRLLAGAAEGHSAALVLSGEAGVGKTALLDAVAAMAEAQEMTIVRVDGVEAEVPLGYAALHRLLLSLPETIDRLPAPQRDALRTTLGLEAGPPPDRFLVALGVLTLLADVASQTPLLCLVDDAQWLDLESAVVLGFVGRRLNAERLFLLFAARELDDSSSVLKDLAGLAVEGLNTRDAGKLLFEITGRKLHPYVQSRLVDASAGNPLALIELARELTEAQLAGTEALPDPLPAAGSLQELFSRRLRQLTRRARLLLALAAAEPTASAGFLWSAAEHLGVDGELALPEIVALVELSPAVRFRHPLLRSVAYHGVAAGDRRLIHLALAEVSDAQRQPDRVAWHRAMAAAGPDEAVAKALEQAADRARERGGYASRTAFLARAAELSESGEPRTERLLAASEAALTAGRVERARVLLEQARIETVNERQAALVLRMTGDAALAAGQANEAAAQLLAAARALTPINPVLGRETLLAALMASNDAGRNALYEVFVLAAEVLGPGWSAEVPQSNVDCLLLGFLHRIGGEPAKAASFLRRAVINLGPSDVPGSPLLAYATAAIELLDADLVSALNVFVDSARRAGALVNLPSALTLLAGVLIREGRFDDAEAALSEGEQLGRATGTPGNPDAAAMTRLLLLCWRGREPEARAFALKADSEGELRGPDPRLGQNSLGRALVVLELSLGRYREAFEQAQPIFLEDMLGSGTHVLEDMIEAAARCDELVVACKAADRLATRAQTGTAHWGLGCLARSRALLAGDEDAERLYHQAIELFEKTTALTESARAHLIFGEWLRRQRRRRDAREELGTAYDMFAGMGARTFAARAKGELEATGEHARQRRVETSLALTSQEAQVARLVAQGETNRDVAAHLFISPATVEYHLRKVYRKLGVASRTQLAHKMASEPRR